MVTRRLKDLSSETLISFRLVIPINFLTETRSGFLIMIHWVIQKRKEMMMDSHLDSHLAIHLNSLMDFLTVILIMIHLDSQKLKGLSWEIPINFLTETHSGFLIMIQKDSHLGFLIMIQKVIHLSFR